jgi:hypothetical protein
VQPSSDERLARGCLALGDLVLVMREDQVDTTGMDVEGRPEVAHAHRRAFEVPARPARPDRRVPGRLRGLRSLPEGEVTDIVLGVLIGLDPLPDPQVVGIEAGEPPICRPARDAEEDRPVARAIGVPGGDEPLDERDHVRDVLGRSGQDVRHRHAEGRRVDPELRQPAIGECPDRDALCRGAPDDLVVDVGDVHHPGHPEALRAQEPDEHVGEQERPEVADVGRSVDSRAAGVDPDVAGLEGQQLALLARQRVEQGDRHVGSPASPPRPRGTTIATASAAMARPSPSGPRRLPLEAFTETRSGERPRSAATFRPIESR